MISVNIKSIGLERIIKKFENSPRELERRLKAAIGEAGGESVNEVKMIITRGGYGSERAVDTGAMRSGINLEKKGKQAIIQTSPKTDYAIYVHEGTNKMRARPFMRATKKKLERTKKLEQIFKKHLDKII